MVTPANAELAISAAAINPSTWRRIRGKLTRRFGCANESKCDTIWSDPVALGCGCRSRTTEGRSIFVSLRSIFPYMMTRSIAYMVALVGGLGVLAGPAGTVVSSTGASASGGLSGDPAPVRHVGLERAIPAVGDTIAVLPDSLRLWFSEPVMVPLTRIRLQHNKRELAMKGAFQKAGDLKAPVTIAVPNKPGPGTYTVIWKTAGADGHVALGTYTFVVR